MTEINIFGCFTIGVLVGVIFFFVGAAVGTNSTAEECNERLEFNDALCELECALEESVLNTLEYYEKECPEAYNKIMGMSE
jgi:hypothetical protein